MFSRELPSQLYRGGFVSPGPLCVPVSRGPTQASPPAVLKIKELCPSLATLQFLEKELGIGPASLRLKCGLRRNILKRCLGSVCVCVCAHFCTSVCCYCQPAPPHTPLPSPFVSFSMRPIPRPLWIERGNWRGWARGLTSTSSLL